MTTTGYRLLLAFYIVMWGAGAFLLVHFYDAMNVWVAWTLVAILAGGLVPSLREISILFASEERVREYMDAEKVHIGEVLRRKAPKDK